MDRQRLRKWGVRLLVLAAIGLAAYYLVDNYIEERRELATPPNIIVHSPNDGEVIEADSALQTLVTASGISAISRVDIWVDGETYRLVPGDCAGFPAGTGIAHTIINNTDTDVIFLVVGERDKEKARLHYPMHPARNAEIGDRHWKEIEGRVYAVTTAI